MFNLVKKIVESWKPRLKSSGYTMNAFCKEFSIGKTRMSQIMNSDKELMSARVSTIYTIENNIKTIEDRVRENDGQ